MIFISNLKNNKKEVKTLPPNQCDKTQKIKIKIVQSIAYTTTIHWASISSLSLKHHPRPRPCKIKTWWNYIIGPRNLSCEHNWSLKFHMNAIGFSSLKDE